MYHSLVGDGNYSQNCATFREENCEVLKPGFRGVLDIYHRSEIYVLHFTLDQRLRYIVISYIG